MLGVWKLSANALLRFWKTIHTQVSQLVTSCLTWNQHWLVSIYLFYINCETSFVSCKINHARCLLPGYLTSTRAVCVENPKGRTRSSRDSNTGPLVQEADALPLYHCLQALIAFQLLNYSKTLFTKKWSFRIFEQGRVYLKEFVTEESRCWLF